MTKKDKISEIISLVFTLRRFLHEKTSDRHCCRVSPLQYITLRFISTNKPRMHEIAQFLAITPPSATVLIDNLIKQEMARREEEKDDRRIVRIVMTKKGEKYIKEKNNEVFKAMRHNLSVLSEGEQTQLMRILGKVVENYKK